MSRSFKGDKVNDPVKIAMRNPNVDIEKMSNARELVRILRTQGVSRSKYNLIPAFSRQMYVGSRYGKAEG